MNKTLIEWVKNPDGSQGYTFNPITGCLNGCPYCYARKLANTRLRERYLANKSFFGLLDKDVYGADPFYPRFWPDKLDQPLKRKKPAGIFTCDMSDLFGIGVPEQWTWSVFNFIKECPQHRFYLLTKQPQNLIKFSPFPENAWVGVSATDYESFYFGATKYLAKIQAKVKYISFEPLLQGMGKHIPGWLTACMIDAGIKWVIIGSQTKPTVMPKIEWVLEIIEACDKARIPVFMKNSLKPLAGRFDLKQELPIV